MINKLSQELLRYGKIIEVHDAELENGYVRVRLIEYQNSFYIHSMINGKVHSINVLRKTLICFKSSFARMKLNNLIELLNNGGLQNETKR